MSRSPAAAAWRPHVCTACSLLCDDVRVQTRDAQIVAVEPACTLAVRTLAASTPAPEAACMMDGTRVEYLDALAGAANILRGARRPLVTGLQRATVEAVRSAIALADCLGAAIDPTDDRGRSGDFAVLQTVGAVTATLGEIAARADVMVTWLADPATTHPRLRERWGEGPRLGAASGGKRTWIAVDSQPTATTAHADDFVQILPGSAIDAASVVRALASGAELDADRVERTTCVPLARWKRFAAQLTAARYAAIVWDEAAPAGHSDAVAGRLTSLALAQLAVALHKQTRAVTFPLSPPGNLVGARQALAWQTGFPGAISFAAGAPEFRPDEGHAELLLARGEVDAVLLVGGDPLNTDSDWSASARAALRDLPIVVLDSAATATMQAANVAIATRRFETAETGTVFRADGVALPLSAAVGSDLPGAEQVLRDLANEFAPPP